jgi:hypothetical protein
MLLEKGPCYNCVWITYLKKNGDDTINLGVAIRHPYPGNDYYTGFDVKGIVHFPAKGRLSKKENDIDCAISLREAGDPELLNADGLIMLYYPTDGPHPYFPPIQLYQPGGNLGGGISWGYYHDMMGGGTIGPLFGFKNYHSSENRRYFASSAVLVRDYHIYIPPGEWDFGYSIDACWAPPLKNPVTKVPDDFPVAANSIVNYRIDAAIVGEINGNEPALLVVDAYSHVGNDFPDFVIAYSGDLFKNEQIFFWGVEPIDMGDHVRWILPVYNTCGASVGWYRIGLNVEISMYGKPEPHDWTDTICGAVWQIVKVHVAS